MSFILVLANAINLVRKYCGNVGFSLRYRLIQVIALSLRVSHINVPSMEESLKLHINSATSCILNSLPVNRQNVCTASCKSPLYSASSSSAMFRLRESIADDDEVKRQDIIWSVMRGGGAHTTLNVLKRKTAAVCGHRRVNPVHRAKIYKTLNTVMSAFPDDDVAKHRAAIREAIDRTELELGDTLYLPVMPPALDYSYESPFAYKFRLSLRPASNSSLFAFERLCFDNRVMYQYYEGVKFSTYVYHNTLYALAIGDAESLTEDTRWQARLASLIALTGFVDYVTTSAFYENEIAHLGVTYNTDFVPKYDVRALRPTPLIDSTGGVQRPCDHANCKNNHGDISLDQVLCYRAVFDPRTERRVPPEYMSVFITFPFKDGHLIKPGGNIVYLDLVPSRRSSTKLTVERMRDMSAPESDIFDASRTLKLDEVVAYAAYADALDAQGVALLILRQMAGDTVKVGRHRVHLPYINEVLEWTARKCDDSVAELSKKKIIMPKSVEYSRESSQASASLIKDIVAASASKLNAVFLCSSFYIPECDYRPLYDRLRQDDAAQYVFFTLVLQQYNVDAYRRYRDGLRPDFGKPSVCAQKLYEMYRVYSRPYRANTATDSATPSVEGATDRTVCPPDKCAELYRFVDPQLAALAAEGDVELNPVQLAAYIALCVA